MISHEAVTPTSSPFGSRQDLERLCIDNLLTAAEERVFFKDLHGRYLMVSAGWLAAEGGGRSLTEVIGTTDFELFSDEYARAAQQDERRVTATGEPVVAKLERRTYVDRPPAWISTTRLPLRGRDGAVIGSFGTTRDVTADVEVHDALTFHALHDPLTGLVNRVALMDRLTQAVVALSRRPGWVGVLFIDLDSFKEINDTFGHDTGDEVIIEAGERLVTTARRVDTVARLGGDELVVLCNELRGRGCLSTVADRLVKALRVPSRAEIEPLALRASVGAACTDDPDCDPMELLHQADLAMYAAKRAGGDRYAVYDAALPGRPRRGARVGLGVDATAEAGAGASLGSVTPVAPANAA